MSGDAKVGELYEFALERFQDAPVIKRGRLCRALALIIGDEGHARTLNTLADELEAIEARHQQLLLDLRQATSNA
jgi:hypothetical protein